MFETTLVHAFHIPLATPKGFFFAHLELALFYLRTSI